MFINLILQGYCCKPNTFLLYLVDAATFRFKHFSFQKFLKCCYNISLSFPTSLIDATNKDVDVLLLLSDKAYYIA